MTKLLYTWCLKFNVNLLKIKDTIYYFRIIKPISNIGTIRWMKRYSKFPHLFNDNVLKHVLYHIERL